MYIHTLYIYNIYIHTCINTYMHKYIHTTSDGTHERISHTGEWYTATASTNFISHTGECYIHTYIMREMCLVIIDMV